MKSVFKKLGRGFLLTIIVSVVVVIIALGSQWSHFDDLIGWGIILAIGGYLLYILYPLRRYLIKACIVLLVIGLIVWGIKSMYDRYQYGQKKPFWKGMELVQVCRTPYSSNSDCYKLNVTLIDEHNARIQFDNGGYKYVSNLKCWFAAQIPSDAPRYTFCRSWDNERQQWDILPVWAYYPSTEDLIKAMEKYKN